jgi:CMP-N,N'-diacetyllegionaminic acid synthase
LNNCIAIVPARGGSKGVPGKNVRIVAGKPLIAWTLETALQANLFQRVIVSTDSPEVAAVARVHRGEVPFMRPPELALDDTPGIDPVLHTVRWLEEHERCSPEFVMLLQPTSPLRTSEDMCRAMELAAEKRAHAVVSVTLADAHPYWMKRVDDEGRLADFMELQPFATRRQDLPLVYALNGAIYLIRRQVLLEQETLFPRDTRALIMPSERSLDVDTAWDLYLADLILADRSQREIH